VSRSRPLVRRLHAHRSLRAGGALAAVVLLAPGCVSWFFSGVPEVDRNRPVALIETTGGVEYGATTEFGVLCLGRTAQNGPCRVHYFLGPTPMVEDGTMQPTGSPLYRAKIDLRTQHLRVHDRPLVATDRLVAMYTPAGTDTVTVSVQLLRDEGLDGDLLQAPSQPLPAGASLLLDSSAGLRFCGLITGKGTLTDQRGNREFYTFAGLDRLRELLAVPEPHPPDYHFRHRVDDITVPERIR